MKAGGSFSKTFRGSFSNTEQFRLHFYCQGHHFGPPEAEGHSKHTQGVIFKHTGKPRGSFSNPISFLPAGIAFSRR